MIVRSKPGLREILFALHGTILVQIVGRLAIIALVCLGAILAARAWPGMFVQISAIPFALIGISLSIFMSFRNNACYDRWWEARKLWGNLIIAARALARLTGTLDAADRAPLLRGVIGATAGLTARLRGTDEAAAIARHCGEGPWMNAPSPIDAMLQHLGAQCLALADSGRIDPIRHSLLDAQLAAFSQAHTGCERIVTTPVPFTYSLVLHRTTYVFCLVLPFALAGALGWWTLLPVLLTSYTFFGLDALSDQLEDPFGLEPNDLPLDAMTRTVEREMLSALGIADLPPVLAPRHYILT